MGMFESQHSGPTGGLWKGFWTIGLATALGQVVIALSSPVLTRLYTPAEFGIYNIINATAALLVAIFSLRWELAIPIAEGTRETRKLVKLALCTVFATTFVGVLVACLAHEPIARLIGEPGVGTFIFAAPLIAGAQAVHLVLNQVAIRQRAYGSIARRNIIRSAVTASTQIAAGLLAYKAGGLIAGAAIGHVVAAVSQTPLLKQLRSSSADDGSQADRPIRLARRYWRFPLLMGPSALINSLGLHIPILMIAAHSGLAVSGWLALTHIVLAVPVALIGQAIGQAYMGEAAALRLANSGRQLRLFHRASSLLVATAIPSAIVLIIFGPILFSVAFGTEWRVSGRYAQLLAPAMAAQLIAVPVSQMLVVAQRAGHQLFWDVGRLALSVGAVGIAIASRATDVVVIGTLSASQFLAYTLLWFLSLGAARSQEHGPQHG